MDTFMDKLASKLNAQEMIRANSAAEAAETEKLRQEVEAYKQCLNEMQEICSKNAGVGDEVAELVRASMDKIAAIQAESGKSEEVLSAMQNSSENLVREMQNQSQSVLFEMKSSSDTVLDSVKNHSLHVVEAMRGSASGVMESVRQNSDSVVAQIKAGNDELKEAIKAEIIAELQKELKAQEEVVHKECVKVYRNVQAVVTEENDKQTGTIVESQNKLKKKVTAAFVLSVLSISFMAVNLMLMLLDILGVFDILF